MEQARQKALELRDSLILNGQENGWKQEGWIQEADAFLDHLANNIADTETSEEEIVDEVFIIIKRVNRDEEPATVDSMTCSKEAFIIQVVRDCLLDAKIPLTNSNNWVMFSISYTRYIMAI